MIDAGFLRTSYVKGNADRRSTLKKAINICSLHRGKSSQIVYNPILVYS